MNDIQDKIELAQIGGQRVYNDYCIKIIEFVNNFRKDNPDVELNEYDISKGAHVPVNAVKRAIRENILEDKKDLETHKKKALTSEERRAELINGLRAAIQNDANKKTDRSKLLSDLEEQKRKNMKNNDSWKNYR